MLGVELTQSSVQVALPLGQLVRHVSTDSQVESSAQASDCEQQLVFMHALQSVVFQLIPHDDAPPLLLPLLLLVVVALLHGESHASAQEMTAL